MQDQHQAKGCGKLKELLHLKITSKFDSKAFIHYKSMRHSSPYTSRFCWNIFPTVLYFPLVSNSDRHITGVRIYTNSCSCRMLRNTVGMHKE